MSGETQEPDPVALTPIVINKIEDKLLKLLQSAFLADPTAVHALMCTRFPCNFDLAEHPHVVVTQAPVRYSGDVTPRPVVGLLGIINGFLNSIGSLNVVSMDFSQSFPNELRVLLGFSLTPSRRWEEQGRKLGEPLVRPSEPISANDAAYLRNLVEDIIAGKVPLHKLGGDAAVSSVQNANP